VYATVSLYAPSPAKDIFLCHKPVVKEVHNLPGPDPHPQVYPRSDLELESFLGVEVGIYIPTKPHHTLLKQ
jgi:hypothetical protein